MTISLKSPIFIAGVLQPTGTSLTLTADAEAELVNRGAAVYTSRVLTKGEGVSPAMINAADQIVDGAGNVAGSRHSRRLTKIAMRGLNDEISPVNFSCFADSTSDGTDEFFYQLSLGLALKYPTHTVTYRLWSNALMQFSTPVVLSTGALGLAHFSRGTTGTSGYVIINDSVATRSTGDMDVRVKVNLGGIAGTPSFPLCGKFGSAGNRSWRFEVSSGGLMFEHTADGTAQITRYAGVVLSGAQLTSDVWLRATLDVDNGAVGNAVRFYTSLDDGATWTQFGATSTIAGVTSVFAGTNPTQFMGRSLVGPVAQTVPIKWYSMQCYNSIDDSLRFIDFEAGSVNKVSTTTTPQQLPLIDDMGNIGYYTSTDGTTQAGSPRCGMFNMSVSGQVVQYGVTNSTHFTKMCGGKQNAILLNYGHNEAWRIVYKSYYTSLTDLLVAAFPYASIIPILQNRRKAPADYIDEHAIRMQEVSDLALSKNLDVIDLWSAWPLSYTSDADGVHPNTQGKAYASLVVKNTFGCP